MFLTLFRKIDTFAERSALGTWIYRVTANAALIKRRGKRVELEVLLEDSLPQFLEDGHREGDCDFLCADWSQGPDEVAQAVGTRAILARALERLPDSRTPIAPWCCSGIWRGSRTKRLRRCTARPSRP